MNTASKPIVRWPMIVLAPLLMLLLAGGVSFYRFQERTMRGKVEEDLSAIARLKANQIAAWRADQLADAVALAENIFLVQNVIGFLSAPDGIEGQHLRARFRDRAKQHDYTDILLVDPEGRVRVSLTGDVYNYNAFVSALPAVLRERRPILIDLHTGTKAASPHLSIVTPLFEGGDPAAKPLGALVLVSDASDFLFPLIQSWPTPSETAETLLVRRDGEDVLFLNPLRHQPDAALKLRIPLVRKDVPAVMAVFGWQGLVEGRDYRGIEVVAVLLPIPDSPWFMVAKVDAAEVFADWRFRSILLLALFLGVTIFIATAGLVLWQREQKSHFRALYLSEASLRASVERHSVTLKAIGDGVIVTDVRGNVELLNPVAEALTGWSDAEARGNPLGVVFPLVDESTGEKAPDPVATVLGEGGVVGMSNHTLLVARDGMRRPIADSGAPIRNENNDVTGVVLVFRDQTVQRQKARMADTRLALIEYSATHRLDELMVKALDEICALAQSPIGFYHFVQADQKTLSLQQWSTRTSAEFCRVAGKGLHYPFEQAGVWADSARWKKPVIHNDYAALQHKRGMPEGHAEIVRELVVPVMRKDQVVAILGVGNKPVDYNRDDLETVAFLSDVTWEIVGHKRAQESMQDSEKRYRGLFESAMDGILIVEAETGKVIDVNLSLSQMLGCSRETFLGRRLWETGSFKGIASTHSAFRALRDNECHHRDDLPMETADGRIVTVEFASKVYLVDHSKVIQCNLRDITERKRLEAELSQAQKMETVGRLAGGVAHDFNNMLGVILGYAEMAKQKIAADDPLVEDLDEILGAARRSADITRQLLAFARRQTITPHVLDLNDTVEGMLRMLRRLIGEDIDLHWRPEGSLWQVKMDPSQVDQILANLCLNARDAIGGAGKVGIETGNVCFDSSYCADHTDFLPGEYVLLAVSDNGRGMDQETLANLFEPFFTTKEMGRGTGLGLATVYGIVKQNDGFINVYSEIGMGTTFKIYLPRHAEKVEVGEISPAVPAATGSGETILVVEDEASVLKLARLVLEGLGYKVLTAGDPTEAIRLAEAHGGRMNLLITDVVMPEMNGRDLAARLHQTYPELKVLFMSGYTASIIAHHGVLDPRVHFMEKPFSRGELAMRVRQALAD